MWEFKEFDDLCSGTCSQRYSDNLVGLFNTRDIDNISFDEAETRLKNKIEETFQLLENGSSRKVTEFKIGRIFVDHREGITFDAMKQTTWHIGDGIGPLLRGLNGFDGLVFIGCIETGLIPKDVLLRTEVVQITHHKYAHGFEQALLQYFTFRKPDPRLRNNYYKKLTIPKHYKECKGSAIYVTYKLNKKSPDPTDVVNIATKQDQYLDQEDENIRKTQLDTRNFFENRIPTVSAPDNKEPQVQTDVVNIATQPVKESELHNIKLRDIVGANNTPTEFPFIAGPSTDTTIKVENCHDLKQSTNEVQELTTHAGDMNSSNLNVPTDYQVKVTLPANCFADATWNTQQGAANLNVSDAKTLSNQEQTITGGQSICAFNRRKQSDTN